MAEFSKVVTSCWKCEKCWSCAVLQKYRGQTQLPCISSWQLLPLPAGLSSWAGSGQPEQARGAALLQSTAFQWAGLAPQGTGHCTSRRFFSDFSSYGWTGWIRQAFQQTGCRIRCPVKQHCFSGMVVFTDCCWDDLLESPKLVWAASREFLWSIAVRLIK